MIRSTYEYQHREWLDKAEQYNFCGRPIVEMAHWELMAALAFMVQYAGDLSNRVSTLEDATC